MSVNFMTVKIDDQACDYCLECVDACSNKALTFYKGGFMHNAYECANCEVCTDVCPNEAITILPMEM